MVTSNFTITASGRLYIDPTSKLTIHASGTIIFKRPGLPFNGATAPLTLMVALVQ